MLLKTEHFAVYHTNESDGMDLCIKDDCGRFALINEDSIGKLIDILLQFEHKETYPVNMRKESLFDYSDD